MNDNKDILGDSLVSEFTRVLKLNVYKDQKTWRETRISEQLLDSILLPGLHQSLWDKLWFSLRLLLCSGVSRECSR